MDNIYFARLHDFVTIPKKRDEDGAYDIFLFTEAEIPAKTSRCFVTGIVSSFPQEYRIELSERSSLAKKGLIVLGGLIDSGYRGEWRVLVYNTGEQDIIVPKGIAICQAKIEVVPKVNIIELEYSELISIKSERGCGGFGSTNKM
jgi:dUTP pyrophosphatase